MLRIDEKQRIFLIRGDTGIFDITLFDGEGNPYTLANGDFLTFTVKKSPNDKRAAFTKTGQRIKIEPSDTASLSFGEYVYDIQLTFQNGDVDTVVPINEFHLLQEVTWTPTVENNPNDELEDAACASLTGRTSKSGTMRGVLSIPKNLGVLSDYNGLVGKPQIESVELQGNKSFSELGLEEVTNMDILNLFK